jgi:2-pyrone-4,6-dicarboxylate lactonase
MTATHDRLAPVRTYQAQPGTPSLRLPPGACDAHVHVFGPRDRYPYSEVDDARA